MSFGGDRHYPPRFWSRLKDWRYEMKSLNDIHLLFFSFPFMQFKSRSLFYPTTFCTTSSQITTCRRYIANISEGQMDIAHRVEQAIQACCGHAVNFLVVISYYLFRTGSAGVSILPQE